MEPAVAQAFGPFAIERVLGEGGSSIVYAARRDGEALALKVLRAEAELTASEKKRFLAEAEQLRRVSHPNVIHVIDAGELPDGRPYLALPLLHGETLAARIQRRPIEHALDLFYAAADAVSALHDAGLLHRDIKPENFFLEGDRLVLLDFGIARDPDASASTSTREGQVRGTPAYMAPERFFGAAASPASEVYELAATLHAMLSGSLPWTDGTDLDQRLDPKLAGTIEPAIQQILRGALAVRAEVRPQSVRAFVAQLRDRVDAGPANATHTLPNAALLQARSNPDLATAPTGIVELATAPTAIAPATTTRKLRRRTKLGLVSAGLIIAGAAATFALVHEAGEHYATQLLAPRRTVVVLNPRNVSGASDVAWMAPAISERIRTGLEASDGLTVLTTQAMHTLQLDDTSPDGIAGADLLEKIRVRTGAQIVVTGTYYAQPDRSLVVVVMAQDAATGLMVGSSHQKTTIDTLGPAVTRSISELQTSLGAPPTAKVLADSLPTGGEASREYAEGLACSRRYAVQCAKDHLDRAVALAPNNALVHEALAEALHALGNDLGAKTEASRALGLSLDLPPEQHLSIVGHVAQYNADWPKAVDTYRRLVVIAPEELRYALDLAEAQVNAGDPKSAFATLDTARRHSTDPRLDLYEARVADKANDFPHELTAASACIRAADELGERELGAYCRLAAGWASVTLGKLDEAKTTLDEALRLFGAEGDRSGTAHTMLDLGTLAEQKGEFAAAQKVYEDALRLARELGSQPVIATTLLDLGQVLAESSDPASARARYEEALVIARSLNDINLIEETLVNLGSLASKNNDIPAARKAYAEALELATKHEHHRVICAVLANTSNVEERAGQNDKAVETAKRAVEEARKTTEPGLLTQALNALAQHEAQAGHYDDALSRFDEVEQLQRAANDKVNLVNTSVTRVGVLMDAGRDGEAIKLAHELLSHLDKASDPDNYGWLNLTLAKNELEGKHYAAADSYLALASSVLLSAGDGDLTGEVHMTQAEVLAARGKLDAAYALIAQVRADSVKGGADALVLEADVVAAATAWKYSHDQAARERLRGLAKDARDKGAGTVARLADQLLGER